MQHPKLSPVVDKEQYKALDGKKALFQGRVVEVKHYETNNQYGSWERGFKFSYITYGVLVRTVREQVGRSKRFVTIKQVSYNHGVTWHYSSRDARKSKGKVILEKNRETEFAFEAIQKINQKWDGPNYRWRP
jgi:hypothetical protein